MILCVFSYCCYFWRLLNETFIDLAQSFYTEMSNLDQPDDSHAQSNYIAKTTVVKLPMVKPNAGLLKVIHLSGAKGEVFTMQEVTHHVIQYIKNRALYDPNDVSVVHCGGDPLGEAFNVNRFTRNEALGLIWKNCFPMQDSCLHIERQVVHPQPLGRNRPQPLSNRSMDLMASHCHHEIQKTDSSSSHSAHTLTSSPTSLPQTTTAYQHKAAKATIIIHDSEIDKCLSDSVISSSDESTCSKAKQAKRPRTSSTSISVNLDEPDRAGGSWECQVMLDNGAADNQNSQNDTVLVEYDSDTFSVEYEVESSSDNTPADGQLDVSVESDVSSTTSGKAAVVIVCETDVEYLADYSDTDDESDPELTDGDKWFCEYCKTKNPPLQRNCGGCWSVRQDWLGGSYSTDDACTVSQESTTTDDNNCSQNSTLCAPDSASSSKVQGHLTPDSDDSREDIQVDGESMDLCDDGGKKSKNADLCVICFSRKKTATLVHGKTGHQACCYTCAKKLKKQRRSCPICRKPIQKVIRNFIV
ncbi:hypothetical protein Btru_005506 [Bulinus truncatus]|nr:hypothetical protein Btru_005506 [Bulinus truncatus]